MANRYTIVIYKAFNNRNIERAWANTYELEATEANPTDLIYAATALANAERHIHYQSVNFLQARISTYEIEASPVYNPNDFTTVALAGTGSRILASGDQQLDLNVCLNINRAAYSGRKGHIFYRGCLSEMDVEQGGDGSFKLTAAWLTVPPAGVVQTYINAMDIYTNPEAAIGIPSLQLIGLPKNGTVLISRPVYTISVAGVTILKRNHKYYDRGPVG